MRDLTGEVFGRLTVVEYAGRRSNSSNYWLCECECEEEVAVRQDHLLSGDTRSCGCSRAGQAITREQKRRGSVAPTYRSWVHMLERCENQNGEAYTNYGGRGIRVCERWHSFENFLEDMGERREDLLLDRIDNDGDYEPGNCRWATRTEQNRNQRSNRLIEFNGRIQCLAAWAEELGIKRSTIEARLDELGWSVERTLTAPVRGSDR